MHATGLQCKRCGWQGELELTYQCPLCGYSLDVLYDYNRVDVRAFQKSLETYYCMWSFGQLLPVQDPEAIVSMVEGNTPLYQSKQELGCRLYLKDETRNPTLSFKDRPNTVGISVAKELGFKEVSIASTGNGGASLSAYAAKAGMACHVCVPDVTPLGKVLQIAYHGAELIRCQGDYSDSFRRNAALSEKMHWANVTSTYINPYTIEGDKTIAYEIFAQLGNRIPDWIVVPLGAGPLLSGIYKGFRELNLLGLCSSLPRMVGVQAEGCAPIINAWRQHKQKVTAWVHCDTVAGAIADPLTGYESDGTRTLQCIYESDGVGVKVSDASILQAVENLARYEGIFAEPASAATQSAVQTLCAEDVIKEEDVVVGIITANGLKDSEALYEYSQQKDKQHGAAGR